MEPAAPRTPAESRDPRQASHGNGPVRDEPAPDSGNESNEGREADDEQAAEDDHGSGGSMIRTARVGVLDLLGTLWALPRARWRWSGAEWRALLGGLALLALLGAAALFTADRQVVEREDLRGVLHYLLHPALLPSLVLGLALRSALPAVAAREEARALERWRTLATVLAVFWLAAALAVAALTVADLRRADAFGAVSFSEEGSKNRVIAVWTLLAVALARPGSTGRAVIYSILEVLVSLVVMKLALALANLIARFLWGIVKALLPFELPARVLSLGQDTTEILAEVTFLAYMLGYAWMHARTTYRAHRLDRANRADRA